MRITDMITHDKFALKAKRKNIFFQYNTFVFSCYLLKHQNL